MRRQVAELQLSNLIRATPRRAFSRRDFDTGQARRVSAPS